MKTKMRIVFVWVGLLVVIGLVSCKSSAPLEENGTGKVVAFYNVENLFDTLDDKHRNDNEFLPYKKKEWNTAKYWEKQHHLARVIGSLNDWKGPVVMGLCEVESRIVLQDLVSETALSKNKYAIVHRDAPDMRGIDVACIYKQDEFELANVHYHPVKMVGNKRFKTREILEVSGLLEGEKKVTHFFFNHWPSRYGGEEKSKPKRALAARVLREAVDSLFALDEHANVVIMGDFNDDPEDPSVSQVLGASSQVEDRLYNVSAGSKLNFEGTLKYKGHWNMFDQAIVSPSLSASVLKIYCPEWLQVEDSRYSGTIPFRTYSGINYIGGYSDHFPIELFIK